MSQPEEDTESLDWGDGARYEEEDDREDVVSLVGGDDDIRPPTAQLDTVELPPPSHSPHAREVAALPSPTANRSLRERLSKPIPVAAKLENTTSFTSTVSQTSASSNNKPTISSGLSTVSHPSLPPKPSAETTAAAEAARRRDEELKLQTQKPTPAHKDSDLPPYWETRKSTTTGYIYYFNIKTGESTWESPPFPSRAKERRPLTPPRHTDDRERSKNKRTNESSDGHPSRERGRNRDNTREGPMSRSPSRERRRRDADTDRGGHRRDGWDRWVPDESTDYDRRREDPDDRGKRSVPDVSISSSLRHREDNSSSRQKEPSRQGILNEFTRDVDRSRSSRDDPRHWSPRPDHSRSAPRDDDRDITRDYGKSDSIRSTHHAIDRQPDWDNRRHRSPDADRNRYQLRRLSLSPPRTRNRRRSPTPDRRASRRESLSPVPISTFQYQSLQSLLRPLPSCTVFSPLFLCVP